RWELFQRAAGVLQSGAIVRAGEELLARRRVVERTVEERAGQRPELVERRDLVLRDGDGIAQPAAAGEGLQARGQVIERQLAHVAVVEPGQLLLVEDSGGLGYALEAEELLQLRDAEEGGRFVVAPPQ